MSMLWLRHGPAAVVLIRPQAWEHLHVEGVALKRKKREEGRKRERKRRKEGRKEGKERERKEERKIQQEEGD